MKKSKAKVVVVGSLNMDLVITAPNIPVPGETILGDSFFSVPGGKGNNQAIAASKLGALVEMVGCIGDDHHGQRLIKELKKNKVGTKYIKEVVNTPSGVALITLDKNAENTIVVASGANSSLSPEHINKIEDIMRDADVLLAQLEVPIETVITSLMIAKRYDVKTILNPAPGFRIPNELLQYVDYLTPNETEVKMIFSYPADFLLNENELTDKLRKLDVPTVIVTKGKDGVLLWEGKQLEHYPSFKVKAKDTTAAGDAFNGALSVALAEGKTIKEAINFAQKAAAITVMKLGTSTSLPYRKEVENHNFDK